MAIGEKVLGACNCVFIPLADHGVKHDGAGRGKNKRCFVYRKSSSTCTGPERRFLIENNTFCRSAANVKNRFA